MSLKKKKYDNIDYQSIIDLGYGPITVERALQLVDEGKVAIVEKNANSQNTQVGTTMDNDIAPVKEDASWFQAGAFEDGYQFGDLTKTIIGTLADINENVNTAVFDATENLIDTTAYGVGMIGGLFDEGFKEDVGDFIAKEILNPTQTGEAVAQYATPFGWANLLANGGETEENSVLGDKSDSLVQSGSHLVGSAALQLVGVPTWLTMGVNAFGSEIESAFQQDATFEEAGISGAVSAVAEVAFEKLSSGIKMFGGKALDEGVQQWLKNNIKNKVGRTVAKYATDMVGEGTEEVLTELVSAKAKQLTYMDDKEFNEIISSEDLFDAFIGGAFISGVAGGGKIVHSAKTGRDYVTGLTDSEEKVVNKLHEDAIADAEKNGTKLTEKQKNALYDTIIENMKHGQLNIEDIESVLGEDTYKSYKDTVAKEEALKTELKTLREMKAGDMTDFQTARMNQLKAMNLDDTTKRDALRKQLNDKVFPLLNNSMLAETYKENARRGEAFTADLSQYEGKQKEAFERAINSGVLNNTYKAHKLVETLSKIEADKGIVFNYADNAKLKESGFAIEGKTVNGFVKDGAVTLNVQSAKAWQSTVGHEITHILQDNTEAYKTLKESLFAYAESKGELESRRAELTKLYKDINNADIDAELTADLVGDYLFNDNNFIKHLTGNRNLFQRIYDEIKYLYKIATGKEKTDIEKVKREFDKAWKELSLNKNTENEATDTEIDDVQYSVSVTDESTLNSLNEQIAKGEYNAETNPDGGYYVTYKSMSFWGYDDEGNAILRSPMAEYVDGELSNAYLIPKDKSKLNWYQATETIDENTGLPSGLMVKVKKEGNKSYSYLPASENQDLIAEDWSNLYFNLQKKVLKNGKWVNSDVPARYNPYEHSSNSMLNDQFSAAYLRDNLVTVKMYVPISEDNGAFRAQWSKDATGWADWKTGTVAGKINKQKDLQRKVYLSRYAAPVEIVPDSEVAQAYKEYLEGTDVTIPDNVVSPNLLNELKKAGVPIEESGKVQYSLDEDVKVLEGGTAVKYSLSTWTPDTQEKVRGNLTKAGYEADKVDKWIDDLNSVAAVIAANKDRLDFEAADNQVMLKNNQDYVKTLDASTLCAKRLPYQGTFNAIQHRLPNTVLTSDDLIELQNMMKEHGYEAPCSVCYVESRRRHLGKFAQEWLNGYEGEYKPNLDEVTTSDGLENLRHSHPQTYQDFVDTMNAKGSANPKVVQLRTEYRNDIMSLTKKQIEKIEAIGGLRVQSFSDFETPHLLDMMQAVMDMSAKGLTSQAYTKVPNFAWVFGDTGIKINLSLIAEGSGLDADGNLIFSSVEGMDINEAMAVRDAYSANVGTIIVGANDAHILACMADDRIDFIIPFHRSGWGKNEMDMMGLGSYEDYSYGQNEHDLETGKKVANLYPPDYWDYGVSGKENAERYLNLCAQTGREPKFSNFLVNNGDGSYSLQPDGSTDGYWKTLIDFKMYDNEGNGAKQQKVQPNFNMDEAYRVLNEYEGGANDLPVAYDVVEEFVNKHPDTIAPTKYSVSKTDSDGNQLSREQQIYFGESKVRDENGSLKIMYHGTNTPNFTVFDPSFSDDKISLFFTDSPDVADSYTTVQHGGRNLDPYRLPNTIKTMEEYNDYMESVGSETRLIKVTDEVIEKATKDIEALIAEDERRSFYRDRIYELQQAKGKFIHYNGDVNYITRSDRVYKTASEAIQAGTNDKYWTPHKFGNRYSVYLNLKNPYILDAGKTYKGVGNLEIHNGGEKATARFTINGEDFEISKDYSESYEDFAKRFLPQNEVEKFLRSLEQEREKSIREEMELLDHTREKVLADWAKYGESIGAFEYKVENASIDYTESGVWKDLEFEGNKGNTRALAKWAKENGYDGVIVKNLRDIGGFSGGTVTRAATIAIAFDSNQVKSTLNQNPTDNPDIRYSISNLDEQPSTVGTPLQDLYYEQKTLPTQEDAPVVEDVAPVNKTVKQVADTGWEIEAPMPDKISPMTEEEANALQDEKAKIDAEAEGNPKSRKQLHNNIINDTKATFSSAGFDFDDVLRKAKNLSTFSTVDNTPQRVMEKALGYKEGQVLSDLTVNKVAQNETEGIKWLNSFTDRKNGLLAQISKQYNIKAGSKESAAAQMYAEGFYVNENNDIIAYGDAELAQDFPDATVRNNIKGLASDSRIRQIYDETLAKINESRTRNAYPEIQRLDNYFLHFRAMEDTFSRLGLPFNPNDIRAKDLPTDLNGVTADLKPGQPYFASAMHRTGKRTSFDLLGGLEKYLTSAKNQIYHIDDIQTLRALRNYIADTYGQANGLEGIDALTEEEAQERIEKVYGSHLSTFAKFLNEEANVLAGKTALIDRGLEGIIGRRGMTFMDTINKQVGSNMVGFNVSSSLTNFIPVAQTFAKTNKADFLKAFAQTVSNKFGSINGKSDNFAENSPVIIRRKGADRFYRTPFQKVGDAGYVLMSAVDNISTELIARTKFNEFTRKGMSEQEAHFETDKWVSRLMGDRSLGQMPQLYNSKMLGVITKFQLEVRNQLDSQFYDTIQEAKVSNEDIQNKLERNAKTAAKVTSTLVQLAVAQHLFGKAFESIAGYNPAFDIISVIATALGFDDDEESEDTALDNIEQGFLELLEDLPYTSTFTGGRIPISSALPIEELIKGVDSYGNEKSRLETLAEVAPYYVLPAGYGQLKKTTQGLSMFNIDEDHPVAGSYTDSGNLRFPVEDTLGNRIQAGLFGQYASENAREYFDNGYAPLKEKQIQEYMDVDMPIKDYWKYRQGLAKQETLEDKFDYISGLDLTVEQKNILINNVVNRKDEVDLENYEDFSSLDEFDFATKYPDKYAVAKSVGGYSAYTKYSDALYDIKADKDANGKTITGSRKEKVINYLNNLDADYETKIILFKSEYPSDDTYNAEIIEYLNNREDLTYEERVSIFTELGFTVSDGYVFWD